MLSNLFHTTVEFVKKVLYTCNNIFFFFRLAYAVCLMEKLKVNEHTYVMYDIACQLHAHLKVYFSVLKKHCIIYLP